MEIEALGEAMEKMLRQLMIPEQVSKGEEDGSGDIRIPYRYDEKPELADPACSRSRCLRPSHFQGLGTTILSSLVESASTAAAIGIIQDVFPESVTVSLYTFVDSTTLRK